MNPSTKHAISNPTLWINVLSLLGALVVTAMSNDWVKENPHAISVLAIVNFALTPIVQGMRDKNKPPAEA